MGGGGGAVTAAREAAAAHEATNRALQGALGPAPPLSVRRSDPSEGGGDGDNLDLNVVLSFDNLIDTGRRSESGNDDNLGSGEGSRVSGDGSLRSARRHSFSALPSAEAEAAAAKAAKQWATDDLQSKAISSSGDGGGGGGGGKVGLGGKWKTARGAGGFMRRGSRYGPDSTGQQQLQIPQPRELLPPLQLQQAPAQLAQPAPRPEPSGMGGGAGGQGSGQAGGSRGWGQYGFGSWGSGAGTARTSDDETGNDTGNDDDDDDGGGAYTPAKTVWARMLNQGAAGRDYGSQGRRAGGYSGGPVLLDVDLEATPVSR